VAKTKPVRWTKEIRWSEIARAAVVLGTVPDDSKKSMFALNAILEARIASGLLKKRKEGAAQSSKAWYQARKG
jgi:hypothetical protein